MRTRFGPLAIGLVVGGIVAGGIGYAAIPHSTTKQITACIQKNGTNKGATRIIDAQRGAACRSTETRIEWSATGAVWRGNWSANALYNVNDIVYHQGTSYRARSASGGVTPGTSSAFWVFFARGGAAGPAGSAGPPGPDGTDGSDNTIDRPGHASTNVDDTANGVGRYASVAIGEDGLLVIAHQDSTAGALRVTHCDDIACTTSTSTTVDDLLGDNVGLYVSMTIGADGLPIIAHQNGAIGALRVSHCDDIACTSATSTTVDDPANYVGLYTSITIGADGLPIIAHRDNTDQALRVTHCDDITCTSAASNNVDDPGNNVGSDPSIVIGTDGLAVIAHYDATAGALRVSHCVDLACTSVTNNNVDDPSDNVGLHTSITIGPDGSPVVAHHNLSDGGLRISRCDDAACTTATSTTIDDPTNIVGMQSSISIGADGLPIIAHHDVTDGELRISHCSNASCTSATTMASDVGNVGWEPSIAIGTDHLPIIAHQDTDADALRVTHCSNRFCLPNHRPR
jgi:hypothetical protein